MTSITAGGQKMSYHIVNIDEASCSLSCKNNQLVCKTQKGEIRTLPMEDIGAIIITSFSASLNSKLILQASKYSIALIICEKFSPTSLVLPANRSSDTFLTKAVFNLSRKFRTQLWQKTLDAKCQNQYRLATVFQPNHEKIEQIKKTASLQQLSKESTCARFYWSIFGSAVRCPFFRRDRRLEGINDLLNFGYTVLLSIILQKIFAVGLDPTIGIHHKPRERTTPLAYDLMEPFRPCVDFRVVNWIHQHKHSDTLCVNHIFRKYVTHFIYMPVLYSGKKIKLGDCMEMVIKSFRKSLLDATIKAYCPWSLINSKWVG